MARTRDIRTNQQDHSCDVCGRTLLRGERAQHEGWIRESGADELALRGSRNEGRTRLVDRLRARRERARSVADAQAAQELAEAGVHFDTPPPRLPESAPPEPPREPRHVRAVP